MPTNRLAAETSPYLLQHAHNPVNWQPWGPAALAQALADDRPILVSIGYAACHWCHVMERECFEDEAVARVMNAHFVCIKVDREERPDVDQVYMAAVQAMGVQGGWPLNVFLLPDGQPFYGGTYFPPARWTQLLHNIAQVFDGPQRNELETSARRFTEVLGGSELGRYGAAGAETAPFSDDDFTLLGYNLGVQVDRERGGLDRAPKFPMPIVWRLALAAHAASGSRTLLDMAVLTLREMAWGGIYDQVRGGFARYSVDAEWLVPHFEKMLYDNGQLVRLYSEGFQLTGEELFRTTVRQTVEWLQLEMTNAGGGFYSSLDADSEGEEGKYYVFTLAEIHEIIGPEAPLCADYYNCTAAGNWEHGRNILHRRSTDPEFAAAHQLTPGTLADLVRGWQQRLNAARAKRVRPGLDHKILTGWNALLLDGLCAAHRAFAEPEFRAMAERNAAYIQANLRDGARLLRSAGPARLPGFLEDYALVIQAFISLYEITFEASWLREAESLTEYVRANFFDPAENLFFFTDARAEPLIARKKELVDNVIPASNSVMAHNLRRLGRHLDRADYLALSGTMLAQVQALAIKEPQHLSNWAALLVAQWRPGPEIVVVGEQTAAFRAEISRGYLFDAVLAGGEYGGDLPLLQGRAPHEGRTDVYVCRNYTCATPVSSVAEALALLA